MILSVVERWGIAAQPAEVQDVDAGFEVLRHLRRSLIQAPGAWNCVEHITCSFAIRGSEGHVCLFVIGLCVDGERFIVSHEESVARTISELESATRNLYDLIVYWVDGMRTEATAA